MTAVTGILALAICCGLMYKFIKTGDSGSLLYGPSTLGYGEEGAKGGLKAIRGGKTETSKRAA